MSPECIFHTVRFSQSWGKHGEIPEFLIPNTYPALLRILVKTVRILATDPYLSYRAPIYLNFKDIGLLSSSARLTLGVIHLWRPQKITFLIPLPLSTCVHMGRTPFPLWTSTHCRHEIHTALLKRLEQWPIPDLKLKFDYMVLIYLNYTISNFCH